MLVPHGVTTLECSGAPLELPDGVVCTLLHEAAHSFHQRRVLDPMVSDLLATDGGREFLEQYSRLPIAGITMDVGFSSDVGEVVIHSRIPHDDDFVWRTLGATIRDVGAMH